MTIVTRRSPRPRDLALIVLAIFAVLVVREQVFDSDPPAAPAAQTPAPEVPTPVDEADYARVPADTWFTDLRWHSDPQSGKKLVFWAVVDDYHWASTGPGAFFARAATDPEAPPVTPVTYEGGEPPQALPVTPDTPVTPVTYEGGEPPQALPVTPDTPVTPVTYEGGEDNRDVLGGWKDSGNTAFVFTKSDLCSDVDEDCDFETLGDDLSDFGLKPGQVVKVWATLDRIDRNGSYGPAWFAAADKVKVVGGDPVSVG